MPTAVLLDTLSIQSYLFGSNKLKENIGGSFIIEHLVYKRMIPLAIKELGLPEIDIKTWTKEENFARKLDPHIGYDIGYIGGGNALLIFGERSKAEEFIQHYSLLLLLHFPGLKMTYGMGAFNYEEDGEYRRFQKEINENKARNRHLYPALTLPYKPGIVDDCAWSNEAQEVTRTVNRSTVTISKMSATRIAYVEDSQRKLSKYIPADKRHKYTFTTDVDKLGQPDEKGYIAIIHADGNGMGKLFKKCKNLAETRKLSKAVADLANNVMKGLLEGIIKLLEEKDEFGNKKLKGFDLATDKDDPNKKILPIRPLIAGGDDITIICEGRLGVYIAEHLLKLMTQTPVVNGDKISACAGIAIVHTKYPFYRAYTLAEELTGKAKERSRKVEGSSWLQYMISTGGFAGKYEEIIKQQYTIAGKMDANGNDKKLLKAGPYRVDGSRNSIKDLKNGMKEFLKPEKEGGWPRNKIKDLRDVLRQDGAFREYFKQELNARGLKLPLKQEKLWIEKDEIMITLFHDMVELMDFYPETLLENE